jgi:hypothetical protein
VVRETMEEVGLRVVRVEGFGSQPWPVPYELMIGHRAVVVPREPVVDPELRAARWWGREELRAALAADEARLPPPYTIGNHAISVWLAEGRAAAPPGLGGRGDHGRGRRGRVPGADARRRRPALGASPDI